MKKERDRAKKSVPNKKDTLIFRLETELKKEFITYCDKNGYSYGKKLRLLIKKELGYE